MGAIPLKSTHKPVFSQRQLCGTSSLQDDTRLRTRVFGEFISPRAGATEKKSLEFSF